MSCKVTNNLGAKVCGYALAGMRGLYLANYYPIAEGDAAVVGAIVYKQDADGYIEKIFLPTGESFYKVEIGDNAASFADALLAGGNGGKYRQHTVNAVLNQYDADILNQGDALSLGKFIAVVVDKSSRVILLGRTNGLSAPAGGFDYNSGAAEADATGWTVILQGTSTEIGRLLKDETAVTPVFKETIVK